MKVTKEMCKNVFLSQLKTVNNKIRQLCSANIIRYRRIFCQSKSEQHAQKNGKNEFWQKIIGIRFGVKGKIHYLCIRI